VRVCARATQVLQLDFGQAISRDKGVPPKEARRGDSPVRRGDSPVRRRDSAEGAAFRPSASLTAGVRTRPHSRPRPAAGPIGGVWLRVYAQALHGCAQPATLYSLQH
jgi:hypothetical protein